MMEHRFEWDDVGCGEIIHTITFDTLRRFIILFTFHLSF
jgi:hypothetical protein